MSSREYAPAALAGVLDELRRLRPETRWALGGILGDASHVYGYHRARAVLPPDDYSVLLHRDRLGDEWAAAALDVTPPDLDHQIRLTKRLQRAIQADDKRLTSVVREVYGTLDGKVVYGWDLAIGAKSTSDTSHLWHVHLSFYRDTCTDARAVLGVARVLAGD